MSNFLVRAASEDSALNSISNTKIRDEVKFWLDQGFSANKILLSPFEARNGEGFLVKKGDFVKESKATILKRGFKKEEYQWFRSPAGVLVTVGMEKTGSIRGYTTVGFME